jgi:hypothetical protein
LALADQQIRSTLTVHKADADNPERALSGAGFALFRYDGDASSLPVDSALEAASVPIGRCDSDASGGCSIGDVVFGTYFWKETEAPQGYLLPENLYSQAIVIDSSTLEARICIVLYSWMCRYPKRLHRTTPRRMTRIFRREHGRIRRMAGVSRRRVRRFGHSSSLLRCSAFSHWHPGVSPDAPDSPNTIVDVETVHPAGDAWARQRVACLIAQFRYPDVDEAG